ncbi:MAG: hypothetical protein KAR62_00405 [Sphingomonadales bacterium]|nr:hypothetical protein [Sphingomonadales bacterium]
MKKYFLPVMVALACFGSVSAQDTRDYERLCKAAIATLNGNPLKGTTSKLSNEIYTLEYVRDDGKRFKYWCKFEGYNDIRWRDQSMTSWSRNMKLSYAYEGATLVITTDFFGEKERRAF